MKTASKASSVFDYLCNHISNPLKIKFDLPNKKIIYNQNEIVRYDFKSKSVFISEELSRIPLINQEDIGNDWKETVKFIYDEYYNSVPSEKNILSPFVACKEDTLSYEDMVLEQDRSTVAVKLQALIVLGVLSGLIKWEEPNKHYWYDGDLYVYRNWISLDENNFKLKERKV